MAPRISKTDFIAAVRAPFELVQFAGDQCLVRKAEEKARLLRTIVSNYQVQTEGLRINEIAVGCEVGVACS